MMTSTAHPTARGTTPEEIPAEIPADAEAWLRAQFDWTFGAVWVARERWSVDAATVVAWAERLRCGNARGGAAGQLSARERKWILAQLSDPEQRPTAAEKAMARTRFLGQEMTPPLSITSIDDAIALLAERLVDDENARAGRTNPMRALLLDDLRHLRREQHNAQRSEQRSGQRSGQRQQDEEREQPMETSASTSAFTSADASTDTSTEETRGVATRDALCAYCGKAFTARRYPYGWTIYCSSSCSGKARFANLPKRSEPVVAPEPEPPSAPAAAAQITAPHATQVACETTAEVAAVDAPTADAAEAAAAFTNALAAIDQLVNRQADTSGASGIGICADGDEPPTFELLRGLIARLPTSGMWSTPARARWLRAFTATLDLEVEEVEEVEHAAS